MTRKQKKTAAPDAALPKRGGIRAYARYRNVSQAAVQKALHLGRISKDADGKIDFEKADRQWEANSDPIPPPNGKSQEEPEHDTTAASFAAARARKETALAEKHEAELAVMLGQLISIDDVSRQLEAALDSVSQPLRSIAPRLIRELERAGVIKPNTSARARHVIEIEIDRLMEELQHAGDHLAADEDDEGTDPPESEGSVAA